MMDTCETCRFGHTLWRKGDKFTAYSDHSYENREHERLETRIECRKYAPRGPVAWHTDTVEVAIFPPMNGETDWCGEHQPKESK